MLLLLQGICRRYLGRASYKSCDGSGGTLSFMVVFLLEELTLYQSVAWIQESEEEDEDEEDSDWSLSTTVGKCVIQRWCFHWVVLWLRWRKLTRSTTPYIKRSSDANIPLNGTYKLSSTKKIALLSGKKSSRNFGWDAHGYDAPSALRRAAELFEGLLAEAPHERALFQTQFQCFSVQLCPLCQVPQAASQAASLRCLAKL